MWHGGEEISRQTERGLFIRKQRGSDGGWDQQRRVGTSGERGGGAGGDPQ